MTFCSLLFLVEPKENVPTLLHAMWLTIVTMTTVGYGDMIPVSGPGHVIVAVLIVSSALYMAIPLGIIGAAFNNVWKQRDCILLVKRARDQLKEKGYTPLDIPVLFKLFDSDQDGELSRGDFIRMIEGMNISLPTERVIELFDTFDSDGGGTIDALEFIRHVFPTAFHELYGEEDESDDKDDDSRSDSDSDDEDDDDGEDDDTEAEKPEKKAARKSFRKFRRVSVGETEHVMQTPTDSFSSLPNRSSLLGGKIPSRLSA